MEHLDRHNPSVLEDSSRVWGSTQPVRAPTDVSFLMSRRAAFSTRSIESIYTTVFGIVLQHARLFDPACFYLLTSEVLLWAHAWIVEFARVLVGNLVSFIRSISAIASLDSFLDNTRVLVKLV